jgi:hypothetical protein
MYYGIGISDHLAFISRELKPALEKRQTRFASHNILKK